MLYIRINESNYISRIDEEKYDKAADKSAVLKLPPSPPIYIFKPCLFINILQVFMKNGVNIQLYCLHPRFDNLIHSNSAFSR